MIDNQTESAAKTHCATLNDNALHALRVAYPQITYAGTRVGYERSDWRATRRERGQIVGLPHVGNLTILATNGVLAWYLRECDGRAILAHVTHFDGDVRPAFSVGKHTTRQALPARTSKPKAQSLRQALLASL